MTDALPARDTIRTRLASMYMTGSEVESLQDDTDLLYVLDSLQLLRFVMELESMFGIKINDSELTLDNLGSVAKMATFVSRKRDESAGIHDTAAARAA